MAANQVDVRVGLLEGPWAAWQGLADGLKGEGLNVLWVTRDVRTLLDGIGTDPPQVAILDVEPSSDAGMGCSGMEGLNLLREARKRRLEVRMLVLSSANAQDFISQCFDEGASGYLFRQSLTSNAVSTAVNALVRGERLFPCLLYTSDAADE